MRKRIVVLANSVKHDPGRCIAGREITIRNDDFGIGPWIRPVSRIGEGELYPQHFILEDGSVPQTCDVIEIYVDVPGTDATQPENWVVSDKCAWKRIQKLDIKMIIGLVVENPTNLWLQPGVKTDRVTREFLANNPPRQSLYLIKLRNATVNKTGEKYRLHFSHKGVIYDLAITDPLIKNITGMVPISVVRRGHACVSLAPAFRNQYDGKEYHYKLAVTVFRHE